MSKTINVKVSRQIAAASEVVFDAWLDPKRAGAFLFATPTGTMVAVEIDPQVGGHFLFTDRRPGEGDVEHRGTYLELDRPRRLAFEFSVPKYSDQKSLVTLDFKAIDGGCEVTLTHEGVLEDYAERTQGGWKGILAGLAEVVA